MPRPRTFDEITVDAYLRAHGGVATHDDLMRLGMPRSTVIHWAEFGPWQRLLPGVVLRHRGAPSQRELRRAAMAYCGPSAVITGSHALDLHEILRNRITVDGEIVVLIPHSLHRKSRDFVVVERTTRLPPAVTRSGFPIAPVARATADAARYAAAEPDKVRELFGAAVQQGRCTVPDLRHEIELGPRQRTATGRSVIRETESGSTSAAEGAVLRCVATSDLPQPRWNDDVVIDGTWVGHADAWWPELGVVLEIDSIRWHSTPVDIRRTQEKQRRYAAAGLLLISIAPADFAADPQAFLDLVRRTLERAARRLAG